MTIMIIRHRRWWLVPISVAVAVLLGVLIWRLPTTDHMTRQLVDLAGQPLNNVTVSSSVEEATTDQSGHFTIRFNSSEKGLTIGNGADAMTYTLDAAVNSTVPDATELDQIFGDDTVSSLTTDFRIIH